MATKKKAAVVTAKKYNELKSKYDKLKAGHHEVIDRLASVGCGWNDLQSQCDEAVEKLEAARELYIEYKAQTKERNECQEAIIAENLEYIEELLDDKETALAFTRMLLESD
jgi:DNA-dependent RNA polymerase auxiliary subunit epsilon